MPPKRRETKKPAKFDDTAEIPSDSDASLQDFSDDEKPKAKRKPAKKPAGSTPKRPKKAAITEPETNDQGWTTHPPSLIYRDLASEPNERIAAFDLDGTLALQKTTLQQPRDADDWVLYNKKVPEKLRDLQAEGFKLVIFSNQGGIKSALKGKAAEKITGRISNILKAVDLKLPVLLATNKDSFRKPETGMWDFFVEHANSGKTPDKSKSFFVGDAAGGPDDFADSDKKFAENIGIGFKTSKEFFGDPDGKQRANTSGGSSGMNDDLANAFRELAAESEANAISDAMLTSSAQSRAPVMWAMPQACGMAMAMGIPNAERFGGNAFAARAYVKAASIIASFPTKIASGKELASLQGIGKGTVAKIDEFISTGTLSGVKKDPKAEEEKAEQAELAMKFV